MNVSTASVSQFSLGRGAFATVGGYLQGQSGDMMAPAQGRRGFFQKGRNVLNGGEN